MPKYLLHASYTAEGVKGLMKEGGTKRRAHIEELIKKLGGKMEAFYYTFGSDDVVVISDLPDATTAVAVGLAVNASGTVRAKTTVLLTPEEIDQATKKQIGYRAPGT